MITEDIKLRSKINAMYGEKIGKKIYDNWIQLGKLIIDLKLLHELVDESKSKSDQVAS